MSEREWVGTGVQQEVTPIRQQAIEERLDRDYAYAVQSETHLWIVTMAHRATDGTLDAFDGEGDGIPILDADTLLMRPALGCYVCEQPYSQRDRRRRCPGEPK